MILMGDEQSPEAQSALKSCPCFNLGLAHRKLSRHFEEALAPLNLTVAQAHFLSCLYERDARLAREVASELGVDAATLTPMIDRLERQGLIRRCPHPDDRRAIRLCLEPAALALRDDLHACLGRATQALTSRFAPAELDTLLSLLQRLVAPIPQGEAK